MPKRTTDFREDLLADLADPQEAAHYLNAAFEDSEQMALVALRDIAEARQMARVAEDAGVAREALYRMLRGTGNPTYSSLRGILNAVGLRITFVPALPASDPAKVHVSADAAVRRGAPRAGKTNGSLGGKRKSQTKKRS
jgi:probable addiction module antidote protein